MQMHGCYDGAVLSNVKPATRHGLLPEKMRDRISAASPAMQSIAFVAQSLVLLAPDLVQDRALGG